MKDRGPKKIDPKDVRGGVLIDAGEHLGVGFRCSCGKDVFELVNAVNVEVLSVTAKRGSELKLKKLGTTFRCIFCMKMYGDEDFRRSVEKGLEKVAPHVKTKGVGP